MLNRNGIFIFTKNRDELLRSGCPDILASGHRVYLIDDSSEQEVRLANEALSKNGNIHYYGIRQQTEFIEYLKCKGYDSSFFLKILGDGQWNLGFARNHALVFAAANKLEKVLFLDHDILVNSPSDITNIFLFLDDMDFAGSKIVGMPDDSILGHVATKLGICFKRMCSGGCLAFRTKKVDHYFLNVYNEDWIWLYLHSLNSRQEEFGEAWQAPCDVFENYENKILFQEIGEITVDGIADAIFLNNLTLSKQEDYWEDKFRERKSYLLMLKDQCKENNEEKATKIIEWLLQNYPRWTPKEQADVFVNYYSRREIFGKLYQDLLLL